MIPGYPTTGWPGDHEMALLVFNYADNGSGLGFAGTMQPWTNYGDRIWVIVVEPSSKSPPSLPET